MARRLLILTLFIGTQAAAQPVDTVQSTAKRSYKSFGFNASMVSGVGLSFRNHFDSPELLQVTASIFSSPGSSVFYSLGVEMQFELSRDESFRFYIPLGLGIYSSSKTVTNLGFGMGLEVPVLGPGIFRGVGVGGELFYPTFYLGAGENSISLGASIFIFYNF